MGIDPLSAILGLGTSIIGGFGAAAQEKKKRQYELEDRAHAEQRSDQKSASLKPQDSFYKAPSSYLSGMDKVLAQVMLGNLGKTWGNDLSGFGVNIDELRKSMFAPQSSVQPSYGTSQGGPGLPQPQGQPQFQGGGMGGPQGGGMPFGMNDMMRRYMPQGA
jgi:hypothetical protein